MIFMFIMGFCLGLMIAGIGLILILHHQDMKDLENRTGRYSD